MSASFLEKEKNTIANYAVKEYNRKCYVDNVRVIAAITLCRL